MKLFFVFDVESVGLHGEGFAVGGGLFLENGAPQSEFRFSCPIDTAHGDSIDREWVKKNIPVLEQTHHTPLGVRTAFWNEWMKASSKGAVMASECGWPVEANFLRYCIDDDPEARKWNGPYPLHEISSFLQAAGMNPMDKYPRTNSELPIHDPLADARQSARLLSEAISKIKTNS